MENTPSKSSETSLIMEGTFRQRRKRRPRKRRRSVKSVMASTCETEDPVVYSVDTDAITALNLVTDTKLADGATSDVILAWTMSDPSSKVAVKIVRLDDKEKEAKQLAVFERETSILQGLTHDNIVKMLMAVRCPSYGALVLEFCSQGDLYENITNMSRVESSRYSQHIACAVNYLHNNRVIHGDLKVENVLVDQNKVAKLCDFGQAKLLPPDNDLVTIWGGTPGYVAPEWSEIGPVNGFKMDLYALGILMWTLFLGLEPETHPSRDVIDQSCFPEPFKSCVKLLLAEQKERGFVSDLMALLRSVPSRKRTRQKTKETQ